MNIKFFKNLLALALLALPFQAGASTLYFDPAGGSYSAGDNFSVNIKMDVEACVNTVEATILFPSESINLVDFLTGESMLSIWVEKPSSEDIAEINKEGKIHFAGGIPGGYCGKIPGDPGQSNIIGKLIFNVPSFKVGESDPGQSATLTFTDPTRVLLNDGMGSEDLLATGDAFLEISDQVGDLKADWRTEIRNDRTPPEPFVIELHSDPRVYDGRYHIVFNTADKQTGVDHYEVIEIRPEELANGVEQLTWFDKWIMGKKQREPAKWKTGRTPYLLEDQSLRSIIKVKAVDKAGNERTVEYIPPLDSRQSENDRVSYYPYVVISLIVIFLIFLLIISYLVFKKLRAKKNEYGQ